MLKSVSVLSRAPLPSSSFSRIQVIRMSTEAGPLCPEFIPVERNGISSISKPEGHKFSVVSYNILAQAYVKSSYFPHSPSSCLRWKARSKAVLTLLKNLGTDFLCLQEVDEYDSFYRARMEEHGYSSIYIKRSGKRKRDGCGIFYKRKSADLVLQENIEYNDLVPSVKSESYLSKDDTDGSSNRATNAAEEKNDSLQDSAVEDRGDPNDPVVRLKRDCVGIMGAFRLKDLPNHLVVVANTHIYWDPEWADVKLAQARYLLSRLAQFKTNVSERFNCTPSVVVTGDFNSIPGDQVYQYVVSGSLSTSLSSPVDLSEEVPISLQSVYAETRGTEPTFTNCTPDFTNTLDYILYSPCGSIKPMSFLEVPGPDSSSVKGGLPNFYHPSDHLPIGTEFEVIGD